MENDAIVDVLHKTGGNVSETARLLGIGRSTVYRKMKKMTGPM
ncbi:helix-turn-helix domain-containing protein [Brevibacillus sp. SIMBA_040]